MRGLRRKEQLPSQPNDAALNSDGLRFALTFSEPLMARNMHATEINAHACLGVEPVRAICRGKSTLTSGCIPT